MRSDASATGSSSGVPAPVPAPPAASPDAMSPPSYSPSRGAPLPAPAAIPAAVSEAAIPGYTAPSNATPAVRHPDVHGFHSLSCGQVHIVIAVVGQVRLERRTLQVRAYHIPVLHDA